MVFSSLIFLFLFLPITLLMYFYSSGKLRNFILLSASLFFYAWGEVSYIFLLLFSILLNWVVGILLHKTQTSGKPSRSILLFGIFLNLLPLLFFKYGNFFVDSFNQLSQNFGISPLLISTIHLPIGISFFTFQAISYIVDIYRKEAEFQPNPINLALYISLFPQLIAGPIVRYHDVAKQIIERYVSLEDLRYGIFRFVTGLGKKVLIANQMGIVADHIFSLQPDGISAGILWLGVLTYSLQIYYDFSGYSDMAIGLGRMFGFRFLENFNYPYRATSIQDFWHRWHISLSSWFRDYLYIPLGGNRKGKVRTYINLVTVFLLCGLWHGASWNFAVWGIYHGCFLILERGPLGKLLHLLPAIIRSCYTLFVVSIGWVFFRAENLEYAVNYITSLMDFTKPAYLDGHLFTAMDNEFSLTLMVAIILAVPVYPYIQEKWTNCKSTVNNRLSATLSLCSAVCVSIFMGMVIIYSTAQIISGTHNPFLYFRF